METVRDAAARVAKVHGLSLVDVQWESGIRGRILRVTIEADVPEAPHAAPHGSGAGVIGDAGVATIRGVTIADCARVSRDLSTLLDADDPIAQRYSLEVSSPGIDRPLRTARDFQRQLGKLIKVKLHRAAVDGQMVLRGNVTRVVDDVVHMVVDKNDHQVALENVREARVVLDLGAQKPNSNNQAKRSKGGRRKASAAKGQHG